MIIDNCQKQQFYYESVEYCSIKVGKIIKRPPITYVNVEPILQNAVKNK